MAAEGSGSNYVGNTKCGQRTCNVLAHNKMICHALKHLNSSVFGLLIGVTYQDSNKTYCHIMDAIPLQHNFFSAMVVEVAALQIEEWLKEISESTKTPTENLRILGVYFANGHVHDVDKNASAVIVASRLVRQFSKLSVLLCQVVADRIESAFKGLDTATDWYMVRGGGVGESKKEWKDEYEVGIVTTERDTVDEKAYADWIVNVQQLQAVDAKENGYTELGLGSVLKNKVEEQLYDFEDHLSDQSKDWRNFAVFNRM